MFAETFFWIIALTVRLLAAANAVYSSANVIPLLKLHTGIANCGQLVLSFEMIRFGRAWWFLGKVSTHRPVPSSSRLLPAARTSLSVLTHRAPGSPTTVRPGLF